MPRVALFGGSFNPPHVAHVMATAWVLSATDSEQVWWLPVHRHPFAKDRHLETWAHRAAMAALALEPFGDRARVDDTEHRLGGTSRTIDTIDHLRATRPELDLRLVVGTDIFGESHLWKEWDRLRATVPFIVLERRGVAPPAGVSASPPLPDVSSTEIRHRLSRGESCDTLVPRLVLEYIRESGLYRGGAP